ncbi:hypothetical protein E3O44_07085 [Cryobacterium algoricola]|uniref:Uncharacterized protein n=1 Tax=Cryobacterium algoricola TaxID=1259183 RepID=A0ABY2IE66_9MICO|nr:hypothetical protein [Cryobacterium algoricola]TFB86922.1 hypothetical protein E3O44_07085 [Cryobacterium algoricola]
MSVEISTLVQPDSVYLGALTILRPATTGRTAGPAAVLTAVAPAAAPARRPDAGIPAPTALEPLVDVVLRLLWVLVGVYVWVVLLVKGPPSRSASRELEPIVWPQADYPAVGLPAVGLTGAGRIH